MRRKSDNNKIYEVVDCQDNHMTIPKEIADCFNNNFVTAG